MFKDQKKELQRLEEELLKDQELYEPALPEEFEEDMTEDDLPEELDYHIPAANGWNSDVSDTDLDELSQEVYDTPRKSSVNLMGIAAALLLLAAALGWLVMKKRGLLP